jgi:hypothetical protein
MTERRGLVLRLLYLGILYARKAVQLGPCERQQRMDARHGAYLSVQLGRVDAWI